MGETKWTKNYIFTKVLQMMHDVHVAERELHDKADCNASLCRKQATKVITSSIAYEDYTQVEMK